MTKKEEGEELLSNVTDILIKESPFGRFAKPLELILKIYFENSR